MLTRFLLEKGKDLTVVEIDRESVAYLGSIPQLDGKILEKTFSGWILALTLTGASV